MLFSTNKVMFSIIFFIKRTNNNDETSYKIVTSSYKILTIKTQLKIASGIKMIKLLPLV